MLLHRPHVRSGPELLPRLKHGFPYHHGLFLLLRRQPGVAGRIGQAIPVPHDLRPVDMHRKIQVTHHAADNRQLLVILLAENGVRRLHQVEQLGKDRADAGKMSRTGRPAQGGG
jgi:hypothetical protein